MVAEYEAAAGLLSQLQSLGDGLQWPYEVASLTVPRTPSERAIATSVRTPVKALSDCHRGCHWQSLACSHSCQS